MITTGSRESALAVGGPGMKVEAILRAKGRTVETTLPTTRIAAAVSEIASS
jgi:hypothetical protein